MEAVHPLKLVVAKEFSPKPGPRLKTEGAFSGEEFRQAWLRPRFEEARTRGTKLLVDLDGGYGYATSFLEEAFGGLARELQSAEAVLAVLEIKSEEEPHLKDEVVKYVREGNLSRQ